MRDGRAVATEHGADFGQLHTAGDMREVHRNLTCRRDVPDAAGAAPQGSGLDSEDVGDGKVDGQSCLLEALRFNAVGKRGRAAARFQGKGVRDL